jgi:hypothetical protein
MSRRRAVKTFMRTVVIDGLGEVTVQGIPIDETARRYPELPGEESLLKMLDREETDDGMAPPALYFHPLITRQIAGQVVDPPMSAGKVDTLTAEQRRLLLRAISEAHPETRRHQRQVQEGTR